MSRELKKFSNGRQITAATAIPMSLSRDRAWLWLANDVALRRMWLCSCSLLTLRVWRQPVDASIMGYLERCQLSGRINGPEACSGLLSSAAESPTMTRLTFVPSVAHPVMTPHRNSWRLMMAKMSNRIAQEHHALGMDLL